MIQLIKDIPTNGNQDYDVLGFIYEYLIGNFAANAGKKAGEFYTPHEVAILMSEIVANHLKDKEKLRYMTLRVVLGRYLSISAGQLQNILAIKIISNITHRSLRRIHTI